MHQDVYCATDMSGRLSQCRSGPQRPVIAPTVSSASRLGATLLGGRTWVSLIVALAAFAAHAQTCAPNLATACADQQRIDEYRHISGVHVYLICNQDKVAAAAFPGLFTATGRAIDGTPITDPSVKRGMQRYLFAAKPGTSFFSRHFYTAIATEESEVEGASSPFFNACKEGTAGSFAAPLLPLSEQVSPNPSYQLSRCASGQRPLWRLFRPADWTTDPIEPVQHRFTDRYVEAARLRADGYTDEYIRACTGDDTYRLATSITPLSTTALAAGGTARYRVVVNGSAASATGMQSGTVVIAWPTGVQAAVVNAANCASYAQLPERVGEANTRLACVFPASSTTQQFSIEIDLTAPAGYSAVPAPVLRAAATSRVVGNNAAAAEGIATAAEIGACADNGVPAYPCAVLSTAAVAPPAPTLQFTINGIDVTNVATGTPIIAATLLASQANIDFLTNIYHKLSSETGWTRVGGNRPRSVSGDQTLSANVQLAGDRRGNGAFRFCAGTSAPADPGNTGFGPGNPACRESAQFTTPQLASTTFVVNTPVVSGASSGTVTASSTISANASDVSYISSIYYKAGSGGTWALLQSQQFVSNGGPQSATLSGYTVPTDSRGTAYIRICASSDSLSSPAGVGSGPSDPACAESPAFITPAVDTQPTLQLSLTDLNVSGADTAQLSVSVKLQSNRSGADVFRRFFYRLSGGAWIASPAFRTSSNGGVQSFSFAYAVPEDQRGTATVAICAGSGVAPSISTPDSANPGPGDPVCAVSASFTTMSASPPISVTLTPPATATLGQPAAWSFGAAAASALVAGPIYLDLTLAANWSFTNVTVDGQPLICTPGAMTRLVRCVLIANGSQLTTTVKSGTVTLTPGVGSGGQNGALVARVSTLANAPTAVFACATGDSACQSASVIPKYVDLRADSPVPALSNLPPSGSSVSLTCSNSGNIRATPDSAFCRIEVLYTDGNTQREPPIGQANWTDGSGELSVCFSTPPSSQNCLLTLDGNKTVRSIVLRAGMNPAGATSVPDNDASNDAQTVYDNSPPLAPTVDVSALPVTGNVGTPYTGSFACSGSTRLQNFTCGLAATTALPAGLQVTTPCADNSTTGNPATRTIRCTVSGTPTAANGASGQLVTVNAASTNATPTTVPANLTLTITSGPQACPAIPVGAEQYDQINDAPRVITIMGLNPGQTRYIKLAAGPWWATQADYQQYGYLAGANFIIPRLPPTWAGLWGISRCPGDLVSSNVVKSTTAGISLFWYASPVGAAARPAPSNSDASGLPGLLVPESQGGQSWYINFRTDACSVPGPDGCRAAYQIF